AAGYVSRVMVMPGGYGNVVFVAHPNGYVSVYAHLQRFSERIGTYVRERQYKAELFEVDLRPGATELPLTQGEVLGLSGNSGSSAGPHLHFEIRDDHGFLVDPQRFRFPEIVDDQSPVIEALALRPLGIGSRLNGAFTRLELYPEIQTDGSLTLPDTLNANGELGIDLLAYDRANGTTNQNGLNCVEVYADGEEIHFHAFEILPEEFSRDLNVHTDYTTARLSGHRFQHCYVADGNDRLSVYKPSSARGRLRITPGLHRVTVSVWDSFQNKTTVTFWVKQAASPPSTPDSLIVSDVPTTLRWSVEENTLILKAQYLKTASSQAQFLLSTGQRPSLLPAYQRDNECTYLWDLRRGLPDSVRVDGTTVYLGFRKMLVPGRADVVSGVGWRVDVGPRALYDTLYLTAQTRDNGLVLGPEGIPFRETLRVSISPALPDSLRARTAAYTFNGSIERYMGGKWDANTLTFGVNELGQFNIRTDSLPPRIQLLRKNKEAIVFHIGDDWSGVKSFRASVDSQWVLMNYDYKTGLIWSEKKDSTLPFDGPLKLLVTDNSGNTATFSADFSVPFPAPQPPRKAVKAKRKKR
ncbi:MAG: M23 family metallopeptidase, partial [Sphingobacteriaceae bacterium]|nr:M23 family metallopeptidase [Cytophagaceae bacterium]